MRYVLFIYVLASLVAFIAYGVDKRAARKGGWRSSEASLHAIELLGGFPGAFIAQRVFRHKWRKRRYMVVFWMIVALHALGWIAWWSFGR